MSMTIVFYEDDHFRQFFPLTLMRPVYVLRAGIVPLYERGRRHFPQAPVVFACRDQVAPCLTELYSDIPVNIIKRGDGDVLLVNGRLRDWGDLAEKVDAAKFTTAFTAGDETAAVLLKPDSLETIPPVGAQHDYAAYLRDQLDSIPHHASEARLYSRPWQLVEDIEREVVADYRYLRPKLKQGTETTVHTGAFLVKQSDIYLGTGVEILPGAVLDASHGPIFVGANTRIEPHAAVVGPTYIGANSTVLAGKITASSIGHTCRVGGEVEESVFHACVNKYHAGFIGHSYVCPWVNFGAMTTNSDLKNNYSSIRVTTGGESVDSGSIKVGSFIGDHTKFGIGTLLNTGISVGVCSNVFGGSLVADKEVRSFQWGTTGEWVEYRVDKALETARRTMERRNSTLSGREAELLEALAAGEIGADGVIGS